MDRSEDEALAQWEKRLGAIGAIGVGSQGSLLERSVAALLTVVREQLDLDVLFIGEFVDENRVFRHISARAEPAVVQPGDFHPRIETVCQRIVDGRMPALVADVRKVRVANGLPDYYEALHTHIGVPVVLPDGRLYGMLCGFGLGPTRVLGPRDVRRLEMAAKATARLLAQAEGRDPAHDHAHDHAQERTPEPTEPPGEGGASA